MATTMLHNLFNDIIRLDTDVNDLRYHYHLTVRKLNESDAYVNALHLMLHGESVLTKEMNGRLFPRHTTNLATHLHQIHPVAEELYHGAIKNRKHMSGEVSRKKKELNRYIVKQQRLLSLCQRMEKVLLERWNADNQDKFSPEGWLRPNMYNERHQWVNNQPLLYETVSEMYGSPTGFHAKITWGNITYEV